MLNPILELDSSDVKAMLRKLRSIQPDLVKEFRREVNAIAKPIAMEIKRRIPSSPPMRGMGSVIRSESGTYSINEGRLRWDGQGQRGIISNGKVKKAKPNSTTISSAIKPTGRSLTTPLVRIILNSAAVSMADMAGRKSQGGGRSLSREYTYRLRNGEVVRRRHRVTTQGRQMIANLGGKASRYGWAGLENRLGAVEREIDKVLTKYYTIANRGL